MQFDALANHSAGGVYLIRLMKKDSENNIYYDVTELANINCGTISSERSFDYKASSSNTGTHNGETWRDCNNNGYILYKIPSQTVDSVSLKIRYWGNESGQRNFDILVNDEIIANEDVVGKWNVSSFQNVEYAVPSKLLKDKTTTEVKIASKANNYAGGLFRLWLYGYKANNVTNNISDNEINDTLKIFINHDMIDIITDNDEGKIKIFNTSGVLL